MFREKIAGQLVSLDRSQRPIVGRKPAAVYRYVDLNMDERKLVKVHKKYKTVRYSQGHSHSITDT